MGVAYGLLAAFCWGLGDYLITALTRLAGTARALVAIQLCSLLAWVGILLVHPLRPTGQTSIWIWALAAGVCHVLGLLLSYRAFEIGTLSLVSPIASGFAVVTAVLAISTGERPPLLALGGAALLFAGVVLATRAPGHDVENRATLAGVPEALGCALAFGIMFWMMKSVEGGLGTVWALILLKSMASGYAIATLLLTRAPAPESEVETGTEAAPVATWTSALPLAIAVAVVDTLAWHAFNRGIELKFTSIVTALASLFSVVTILLAWLLLKERLAKSQWAGVAIILLGVLLVSLKS